MELTTTHISFAPINDEQFSHLHVVVLPAMEAAEAYDPYASPYVVIGHADPAAVAPKAIQSLVNDFMTEYHKILKQIQEPFDETDDWDMLDDTYEEWIKAGGDQFLAFAHHHGYTAFRRAAVHWIE